MAGVVACLAVLPATARGDIVRPWAPMEMVAFMSDRIAVVQVAEVDKPVEKPLLLTDGRTHDWWFTRYSLKVTKTIKGADVADGAVIEAFAAVQPQAEASRNYHGHPMDDKVRQDNVYHAVPNMLAGGSYVVFLARLPAARPAPAVPAPDLYYVLNAMALPRDGGAFVASVRKAADPDTWNWSKPVDGLQLALILPATVTEGATTEGGGVQPAKILTGFALRNASQKPLAVNLHAADRFVGATVKGADGKILGDDFYVGANAPDEGPFDAAADTVKLKPGEVRPHRAAGEAPGRGVHAHALEGGPVGVHRSI